MDNLVLAIDFTGVSGQTGTGMGYLTTGFHTAAITSFKVYGEGDAQRLYAYMLTDGTTHRENWDLQKAKSAIKGFLLAAGLTEAQLAGAVKVPFHKLAGKTIHFYYTAPTLGEDKKPVKGGWPKYNWLTKAQYDAATSQSGAAPQKPKAADLDLEEEAIPAPAPVQKTAPAPKNPPTPASSGDDFGFLSDDE